MVPVIGRNNRHSRFWHANYRLYRITKQIEEHQRHFNPVHIDSDVFWNLVKELCACLKEMGKRVKVSYF